LDDSVQVARCDHRKRSTRETAVDIGDDLVDDETGDRSRSVRRGHFRTDAGIGQNIRVAMYFWDNRRLATDLRNDTVVIIFGMRYAYQANGAEAFRARSRTS
jgi:hypothetical protein